MDNPVALLDNPDQAAPAIIRLQLTSAKLRGFPLSLASCSCSVSSGDLGIPPGPAGVVYSGLATRGTMAPALFLMLPLGNDVDPKGALCPGRVARALPLLVDTCILLAIFIS